MAGELARGKASSLTCWQRKEMAIEVKLSLDLRVRVQMNPNQNQNPNQNPKPANPKVEKSQLMSQLIYASHQSMAILQGSNQFGHNDRLDPTGFERLNALRLPRAASKWRAQSQKPNPLTIAFVCYWLICLASSFPLVSSRFISFRVKSSGVG